MTSSHTYTHRRVGGGGFTYYAHSPVTPVRSAPGPGSRPADGVPHFRLGPRSGKLHEETSPSRTHPPAHTCPSPAPSRPHLPVPCTFPPAPARPSSLPGVNGPTWHLSPDSPRLSARTGSSGRCLRAAQQLTPTPPPPRPPRPASSGAQATVTVTRITATSPWLTQARRAPTPCPHSYQDNQSCRGAKRLTRRLLKEGGRPFAIAPFYCSAGAPRFLN